MLSMQEISKNIVDLRSTVNQLEIFDIYRILYTTVTSCTFFSGFHGTLTDGGDHVLNQIIKHIFGRRAEVMQLRLGVGLPTW